MFSWFRCKSKHIDLNSNKEDYKGRRKIIKQFKKIACLLLSVLLLIQGNGVFANEEQWN